MIQTVQLFIRFKYWPEAGSTNHFDDSLEHGVCCHECRTDIFDGLRAWQPTGEPWQKTTSMRRGGNVNESDLQWYMNTISRIRRQPVPIYLITGDVMNESGADGEPKLKIPSCDILAELRIHPTDANWLVIGDPQTGI